MAVTYACWNFVFELGNNNTKIPVGECDGILTHFECVSMTLRSPCWFPGTSSGELNLFLMQKYFLAVPDPDTEIRRIPDHYFYMFFF